MTIRMHSDMLLGPGVLAETIQHFEMEAARAGTAEAWQTAYDRTRGIDYLWIVYRSRMNYGTPGLFESIALSNQLGRLMKGLDSEERDWNKGDAATHRALAKAAWEAAVDQNRCEREAA